MRLEVLFSGFPAFSSRGYLGWSTVVLIQCDGLNILFDAAGYNERLVLLEKLKGLGLTVDAIDIVILSHLHYDHAVNFNLFPKAQVVVSRCEWEFAKSEEGRLDPFIPLEIAGHLRRYSNLRLVEDGEKLAVGLTVYHTPGHTPGGISLLVEAEQKYLLTGDAIKNGSEFVKGVVGATREWLETRERIRGAAGLFITGHDRPFYRDEGGKIIYESAASIDLYAHASPYENTYNALSLEFGKGTGSLTVRKSKGVTDWGMKKSEN